ncbi:hypothetical protein GOP47_0024758 [Adiantum capillus-veneris]|uniref:Uncharacterized protein n=1 Tax=Adiantum capillus-veneris TaxID=13818 RepID=A0A9D4Z2Y0_ADICA|nr:hypothetical protein GOP47_0024758 [Adiantum capillus-veneris]
MTSKLQVHDISTSHVIFLMGSKKYGMPTPTMVAMLVALEARKKNVGVWNHPWSEKKLRLEIRSNKRTMSQFRIKGSVRWHSTPTRSMEIPIDLITPPSLGGLHHPIYLCTPTPEKASHVPKESGTSKVVHNENEIMESNTMNEENETWTTMQGEVEISNDKPTKGRRKPGDLSKHNIDSPRQSARLISRKSGENVQDQVLRRSKRLLASNNIYA